MATPTIEAICKKFPNSNITLLGNSTALNIFTNHPKIKAKQKLEKNYKQLYALAKKLGRFDIAISFRSSFRTKLLLFFIKAKKRYQYKKNIFKGHQVEKYYKFVDSFLGLDEKIGDLKIYIPPKKFKKPTLGINPGATYGSAKRWDEEKFAEVAKYYAKDFDIVLFGSKNESDICEKIIKLSSIKNITNLAGKTSIEELCELIGGLSLFVTNDSGPMHIAAAYKIPTVAIFGPTSHTETNQWRNPKSIVVRHDISCSPCFKRECPIKSHECMKMITSLDVIEEINKLLLK